MKVGITDPPVAIKQIEKSIVDRGFKEGWIVPNPPKRRTGKQGNSKQGFHRHPGHPRKFFGVIR